jgi:hypothetical protein
LDSAAAFCVSPIRALPNEKTFVDQLFQFVSDRSSLKYNFIGPCNMFEFTESATELVSRHVSVRPATALTHALERGGDRWRVVAGDGFATKVVGQELVFEIGGLCWDIKTRCAKAHTAVEARWMAEIFVSMIRLGLTPSDYCHRARLGETEPEPTAGPYAEHRWYSYNETSFLGGGIRRPPRYKVTARFAADFHAEAFQKKLEAIFDASKGSVAARVADGLGWLSRGRQSSDMSERLLYSFTAMEALFAPDGSTDPVSDTIARLSAVVLTTTLKAREPVHRTIKELYALRSKLVHRGTRGTNLIDANSVQNIAETAYWVVLGNVDLQRKYEDFREELRVASFGSLWPDEKPRIERAPAD